MKKVITFIALFLLPLSAQAIVVSGHEDSSTASDGLDTSIHADVQAGSDTGGDQQQGEDNAGSPASTLSANAESDTRTASSTNREDVQHEDSSAVETENDLAKFNDSVVASNKNVESVDTQSDNEIDVEYHHSVKLLGIIPVSITSKTTASLMSDGTPVVTTTFPWWKIFIFDIGDRTDKIDSAASAAAKNFLAASTSVHAKAQLTEAIVATLNAVDGAPLLGQ